MRLINKAGFGLIALGFGILGAWDWWTKTRNYVPVNVPVSLSPNESISSEFKLNFDGLYLIEIEAEKTIPLDTLQCLMGVQADPSQCQGVPPAVAATWVLSNQGKEIARGSSNEQHSAPIQTKGVVRVIGEFQGKAGQKYALRTVFTANGERLAAAHPRLKVSVASIAYTDLQSASMLVISMVFICELFGTVLLGVAFYAKHRAKSV